MNKYIHKSNQNVLDFILTYKGSIQDNLFPFLEEQMYACYSDFDNSTKKFIKTKYNKNKITENYKSNNKIVATKTDMSNLIDASFDFSFDLSFES